MRLIILFTLGLFSLAKASDPTFDDLVEEALAAKPSCKFPIATVRGSRPVKGGEVRKATAELLKHIKPKTDGEFCNAKAFIATQDIKVYRFFNTFNTRENKAKGAIRGNWWTDQKPGGSIHSYRVNNDICPGWSPLDGMWTCYIKKGSMFLKGPGQSALCDKYLTIPAQKTNQLYVLNPAKDIIKCGKPNYAQFNMGSTRMLEMYPFGDRVN